MLLDIELVTDTMPDLLPMVDRRAGIHVSAVIHRMATALGHYKERPMNRALVELGNCFEWALIQRIQADNPGRFIQPGEQVLDDIAGTPDLLDVLSWEPTEIKCTFLSSNHEPESTKLWKWWVQLMAYAHMIGATAGVLRVLHIRGDYRDSGPQYREWRGQFSERDLLENWAMIVSNSEGLA